MQRGETIAAIDVFLYRRDAPNPWQSTRFHPAQPDAPAVFRVRLSDLFFGVARDRLPMDLQQRDEAVADSRSTSASSGR